MFHNYEPSDTSILLTNLAINWEIQILLLERTYWH